MPVPLTMLSEGEFGKVVSLTHGSGFRMRMTAMGFTSGAVVKMVKKTGVGPIMIEINGGSRIAIGWGQANKILVEPIG